MNRAALAFFPIWMASLVVGAALDARAESCPSVPAVDAEDVLALAAFVWKDVRAEDEARVEGDAPEHALAVPRHAVVTIGGAPHVFTAGEGEPPRAIPVTAVVERHRAALQDAGVMTEVRVEDDMALADPVALGRLLENLVENARRHSQASELKISSERHDGHLVLHVRDDGCGLPETVLESLFVPFAGRPVAGASHGLGLYIAERLARRQGGRLQREESVEGTHWSVSLPAGDADVRRA